MEITNKINNLTGMAETREVYEAPVIETVEVKVERGFQESGFGDMGSSPGDSWSY